MPNVIRTVGSSTVMVGSATGFSGWARVSPMEIPSKPEMATISPASAEFYFNALQTFVNIQVTYLFGKALVLAG